MQELPNSLRTEASTPLCRPRYNPCYHAISTVYCI